MKKFETGVVVDTLVRNDKATSIRVWLFERAAAMNAYLNESVEYEPGTIVECRIGDDATHIEKMKEASAAKKKKYADNFFETTPNERVPTVKKPTAMKKVEISLPQFVSVQRRDQLFKLEGILNSLEAFPKVIVEELGRDLNHQIIGIIRHVKQKPDDKYLSRMRKKYDIPHG